MPKRGANISLSSYDDIFETDASRAEAKQERIQSISILDLVPFENHPFKVVDDEAMLMLYCIISRLWLHEWSQAILATGMTAVGIGIFFGAGIIISLFEEANDRLGGFIRNA